MPNIYTVKITETLSRLVTIGARNEEEAYDMAQELYDIEEIVLDAEDYQSTEMEIVETEEDFIQ